MNNMILYQEEKQQTPLPQLIKQSATYKLIVPKKVEEKIRYLIRKFPHTEWSGVLFARHTGTFEGGDLLITCEDIYPMDLGTGGWTEFKMTEDVTAYIADNIELFDCDIHLLHSHHHLGAFFSGQDIKTLNIEGNDTNCFVSLIVDTKGEYKAAITRKVISKKEVITKDLGSSYEFFGDGSVSLSDPNHQTSEVKTIDHTVIEYFMLDVEREAVDNPHDFLDRRFDEIESKKQRTPKASVVNVPSIIRNDNDYSFKDWRNLREEEEEPKRKITFEAEEPTLWPAEEMGEVDVTKWKPNPQYIHDAVVKMVLCSLTIKTDGVDLRQWITRHMKKIYTKLFDASMTMDPFEQWCEFITTMVVENFSDETIPEELYEDEDTRHYIVAKAMYDELYPYYDNNEYIEAYCNHLIAHYTLI